MSLAESKRIDQMTTGLENIHTTFGFSIVIVIYLSTAAATSFLLLLSLGSYVPLPRPVDYEKIPPRDQGENLMCYMRKCSSFKRQHTHYSYTFCIHRIFMKRDGFHFFPSFFQTHREKIAVKC